jgi:hypothetical protein
MVGKSKTLKLLEGTVERSRGLSAEQVRESLFSDEMENKWYSFFRRGLTYLDGTCLRVRDYYKRI